MVPFANVSPVYVLLPVSITAVPEIVPDPTTKDTLPPPGLSTIDELMVKGANAGAPFTSMLWMKSSFKAAGAEPPAVKRPSPGVEPILANPVRIPPEPTFKSAVGVANRT